MYQNIVQLGYVDKLLDDIKIKFRDMYKNELSDSQFVYSSCGTDFFDNFNETFQACLLNAQQIDKIVQPKVMRNFQLVISQTYGESSKSQKTVASMLIQNTKVAKIEEKNVKDKTNNVESKIQAPKSSMSSPVPVIDKVIKTTNGNVEAVAVQNGVSKDSDPIDDEILRKRAEFIRKQTQPKASKIPA
uniref:Signal recognition particle receptor alpha subunit N-terminal domain-containing protein n=1 Tax=Romanomermis culicivorax TaxID=13658 RepID=A0A915HVG6_ROMCU